MKPVYASLRMLGHKNSGYIDDSLFMADTRSECADNVFDTIHLMSNEFGFIIHGTKSVLVPRKKITFLGNNIDSEKMIVTLPKDKVKKIVRACTELFKAQRARIRQVVHVLGLMVSSFSAVEFGPLHYRIIEHETIQALRLVCSDYDSNMIITSKMRNELFRWIKNLHTHERKIDHGNLEIIITQQMQVLLDGVLFAAMLRLVVVGMTMRSKFI